MKTRDTFGEYMECLQCGYVQDIEMVSTPAEQMGVLIQFPGKNDNEPLQSA